MLNKFFNSPLAEFADYVGPAVVIWLVAALMAIVYSGFRRTKLKPDIARPPPEVRTLWCDLDGAPVTIDDLNVTLSLSDDGDATKSVHISPPMFGVSSIRLGKHVQRACVANDRHLLVTLNDVEAIVLSLRTGRQLRIRLKDNFYFEHLSMKKSSIFFDYELGAGRDNGCVEVELDRYSEFRFVRDRWTETAIESADLTTPHIDTSYWLPLERGKRVIGSHTLEVCEHSSGTVGDEFKLTLELTPAIAGVGMIDFGTRVRGVNSVVDPEVWTSADARYIVVRTETRAVLFDVHVGNRIDMCVIDEFYIDSVTLWRSCVIVGSSDRMDKSPKRISLPLDREASLEVPSDADYQFWGDIKIMEG